MTTPVKPAASQTANGVTPKPRPEIEVGVSNYLPFITPYQNAWEVLRSEEVTVNQLKAMRKTDGQARALYRLITLPIRSALKTATFVPESNVHGGEEEAAFVEQMLTLPSAAGGMVTPFSRVIAQMLMAIFDGFVGFELVYWSPKTGPLKGKWTLKKLAHRPAETLTFLINDNSEFAGFRQRAMYQNRSIDVKLPGEHCIYYAANEEEKPFYGQSYFQSAWYHWDKKFKLYAIAHIAAQRAAVGTRVGKLPPSPNRDEKDAFKKALADLGVAQYMTIPQDFSVEALKEGPGFDFLAYINHHNSQMSKSVLAAFFDDQQGSGGDTTLVDFGRQSDALFMMMLQTIMSEIEDVLNNQVIPRFIDWNFGTNRYPKFQFGTLTQEQQAAAVDLFKTLAIAGQALTCSPEFVHQLEIQVAEEFGLEIDWEAVEARQAAETEAAAQPPGAGPPGSAPGAAPSGPPQISPQLLPAGFTLGHRIRLGDPDVVMAAQAAELLQQAADDLLWMDDTTGEPVELTRGKPASGVKHVRTPAGAQLYGAPIGTPITRDLKNKQAAEGVKGKVFGVGVQGPNTGEGTQHQTLGGGPGAKAQSLGGVAVTAREGTLVPKQILTNQAAPGAQLLDFGDGTVAVRDAAGRQSARQRFDIAQFSGLGWKVDPKAVLNTPASAAPGGRPAVAKTALPQTPASAPAAGS